MVADSEELLKTIRYYQESLNKYSSNGNEYKVLSVIKKLKKLPITTAHLENTGIGRTVNALRKLGGEIGDAAKGLVARWKEMVVQEDVSPKEKATNESSEEHRHSTSNDSKSDSNKHKYEESSKSEKHSSKTRRESVSSSESESESNENVSSEDESNKHSKSHEKNKSDDDVSSKKHKYEKSNRSDKHSSKRKHYSSNSESEDSSPERKHRKTESKSHKSHSEEEKKDKSSSKSSHHKRDSKDKDRSSKKEASSSKRHSSKRKHHNSSDSESDEQDTHKSEYKHRNDEENRQTQSKKTNNIDPEDNKKHRSSSSKSSKHEESSSKSKSRDKSESRTHDKSKSSRSETPSRKESNTEETRSTSKDNSKSRHEKESSHSGKNDKKDKKERDKEESKDKHHSHKRDDSKREEKPRKSEDDRHSKKEKSSSSTSKNKESADGSSSSHHKSSKEKKEKVKIETVTPGKIVNGIDSESGASFAEALGMCGAPVVFNKSVSSSSKKKVSSVPSVEKPSKSSASSSSVRVTERTTEVAKKFVPDLLKELPPEPLQLNISNLLPEISPNYKPVGFPLDSQQPKRMLTPDEALSQAISNKNMRTKVYSGNKTKGGEVESLFNICVKILQDNLDAMEDTGGVPYIVLKPVLEKATPNQLFNMEHHNPYLIEDTDELWKLHCLKAFRTKTREEMETWREMYMRCLDEREAKLNTITANIKQAQDKSVPVRTTKLAYLDSFVKPPRNIARKQAKNGIIPDKTPTKTKLAALATSGEASKVAVPNPGSRAVERSNSSSNAAAMKPKKAPLMAKTLSLFKNRFKR